MALGFTGGIARRSAWAAGLTLLALGAVLLVEGLPSRPASADPAPTGPAVPARSRDLTAEATYAVARWTVVADGIPQAGSATTATTWRGEVHGQDILVQAEPADPLHGPGALRLSWPEGGRQREVLAWCDGAAHARIRPAPGR